MKELQEWFDIYERKTVYDRAVPNIMDGLKPVQRKIYYTALETLSKYMNTGAFSGILKTKNYHHGDASRDAAICNMTSDFKNQIPMFIGDGNFGNRLENTPAATRYTQVKLNPEYKKFMIMNEILKYSVQDDNNFYEPDFYYFSIPMILVNGISGIAVGVKTDILSYCVEDIEENIRLYLNGMPMKEMKPYIPNFIGEIKKEDEKWVQCGIIKKVNTTTLQISEIPNCFDRTQYINILEKLKEKKIIEEYEDNSTEIYDIIVKVTRKQMEKIETDLYKTFRLKNILNENIKALSPEGNSVLEYSSPLEVIKEYMDFMITRYIPEYIQFKKKEYEDKNIKLNMKITFIEYILSIDIRNYTMKEIKKEASKLVSEEFILEFMQISLANLTKDAINKYKDEIKDNTIKIKKYSNIKPKDCYLELLKGEK